MSFAKRLLNVQFTLANGEFEGGGNQLNLAGLRVSCHIINTGGFMAGQMEMAIWGMSLSQMNQLATTGTGYLKMYNNKVQVFAGDEDAGTSLIWAGSIVTAQIDGQEQPNVCLRVMSLPGGFAQVQPANPLSIQGSGDAAQMLQQIANAAGFTGFENAGVNVKLSNPYYAGSLWQQMQKIAKDGGFDLVVDRGTICAVAPDSVRGGSIPRVAPPDLFPDVVMKGYPSFDQQAIVLTALYSPQVQYYGSVNVQSSIQSACGQWKVNRLEYLLDSRMPSGKWEMVIEGVHFPTVS